MPVASVWGKSIHQNTQEALKHSLATALGMNAHCLLHGESKKQLPDSTSPCPVSQHIYTWQRSHAHHRSSRQECPWLLEGQIALFTLSDPSQFLRILPREGPREVLNWAKLRCICASTCPLGSWRGCKMARQAGARYLLGTGFSSSSDIINNCPNSLLHSWTMSFLQIFLLASPTEKKS